MNDTKSKCTGFPWVIIGYSFINVKDHLVFLIKVDNLPKNKRKKPFHVF